MCFSNCDLNFPWYPIAHSTHRALYLIAQIALGLGVGDVNKEKTRGPLPPNRNEYIVNIFSSFFVCKTVEGAVFQAAKIVQC